MAKIYWDLWERQGLIVCKCPKCGNEKMIMHIGKHKTTKCIGCQTKLRYRWRDIRKFDKGTSRVK